MDKNRLASIAAWVAVAGFVIATIDLVIGTSVTDTTADDDPAAPWIVFWISVAVASIAVLVVLHGLLARVGVQKYLKGWMPLTALIIGAIGCLGAALVPWAFFAWGPVLAVAFLIAAVHLRKAGKGVIGIPSFWDWVIPIVGVLGVATTWVLYQTNTIKENPDDLDWAYTIGFAITALGIAATMAMIAPWLRTAVPALARNRRVMQ